MSTKINDTQAYTQVVDAFKRRREGATPVDIVSMTGLPVEKVKELAPAVADEFGARLRVTESGEILYSFPDGFKSRYKGFGPGLKRFWAGFKKTAAVVGKALFKIWIMVMLVGYFMLFMAIALVALVASVAVSFSGQGNDRDDRRDNSLGGLMLLSSIFDLIIRIWFYSELVKAIDDPYGQRRRAMPKRPLHHAVFSFVFGDGDPNAGWDARERKAVVSYIQSNKGVISLPEFMAITGKAPSEADAAIIQYMVEFGGSPEATEDGTVVYRFDEMLKKSDKKESLFAFSAPLKKTKTFSVNPKKLNGWFIALNGVNLLFGGYFLFNALTVGLISHNSQVTGGNYLYAVALVLFSGASSNPVAFVASVLGVVPLAFAALFYLIPAFRSRREKAENERIKNENLRKDAYKKIWDKPAAVKTTDFNPSLPECRPDNLNAARERMITELGAYAAPEVALAADGSTQYDFPSLTAEKQALEKYRSKIDLKKYELGATVFDSHS